MLLVLRSLHNQTDFARSKLGPNWDLINHWKRFLKHKAAYSTPEMVRPKASQCVCDFASTFAFAVTAESSNREDLIARSGSFSIFALLSRVAPKVATLVFGFRNFSDFNFFQACRLGKGSNLSRNGISNVEMNKLLEKLGFSRIRVRLRSLMRYCIFRDDFFFLLSYYELFSQRSRYFPFQ